MTLFNTKEAEQQLNVITAKAESPGEQLLVCRSREKQ